MTIDSLVTRNHVRLVLVLETELELELHDLTALSLGVFSWKLLALRLSVRTALQVY